MELREVALDPWQGIYRELRDQILTGKLRPGARLAEADFATEFGTSRGPVRTAFRELERAGLLDLFPRRGAFIKSFSEKDVEEILGLWEVIWTFGLRRAIERISTHDVENLRRLFKTMDLADDPEKLLDFALEFHRAVFMIGDHERALEIYDSLMSQARLLWLMAAERWTELDLEQPGPPFIDALERKDEKTAIDTSVRWRRQLGDFLLERAQADGPSATQQAR